MQLTGNIDLTREIPPLLLSFLTKDPSALTSRELVHLRELGQLENNAQSMSQSLHQNLLGFKTYAASSFEQTLDKTNLGPKEKDLVNNIFKKTVLLAAEQSIDKLAKSSGNVLYSMLLSETTVNILDSILYCKKSFDKNFPGASEVLWAMIPIVTAIISIYSPPIGLLLKSTNILEHTAKFLSTKNLESTIDKMRGDLLEIKNNKQLARAQETGEALEKLSEQAKISPTSLNKMNLSLESATYATQEVVTNIAAKRLLEAVSSYADKSLPSNPQQIERTFEKLKESMVQELQKSQTSLDSLEISETLLDSAILQAKKEMTRSLDPDDKIFDKISSIQKSADIMDKAAEQIATVIGQENPRAKNLKEVISTTMKQEVAKTIRGKIEEVAKHLTSESNAKDFAKKALGSSIANEMTIKSSLRSQSVERGR